MKGIKHIFFDLDETLWDFERNAILTFEHILPNYTNGLSLERFLTVYFPINQRYWQAYRNKEVTREGLQEYRFVETFQSLKINLSKVEFNGFMQDYQTKLVEYSFLFPEVKETLIYLNKQYRLHIITDGFAEVQTKKLKNSAINTYFQTMTTSDEIGVTKPDAKIFEEALAKARAVKGESVMIGDNLEFDVFGAIDAGLKAIHFTAGKDSVFRGKKINTIGELRTIF